MPLRLIQDGNRRRNRASGSSHQAGQGLWRFRGGLRGGGDLGDICGDVGDGGQAFQDGEEVTTAMVMVAVAESRVIPAVGMIAGTCTAREQHHENDT